MVLGQVAAALVVIALCASLDVRRPGPADGAALAFTQLLLRATTAVGLALALLVYVPGTAPFAAASHWCLHTALPGIRASLGVDGHGIAALALLVPTVLLLVSLGWAARAIWRGARAVSQALRSRVISGGPAESLIIPGRAPFLAAAGLRKPRVVVSMGAVLSLDDAELAASLQHEWGHIARRHRFISLAAHLLYALARPLPGSSGVIERLDFCLERDADEYAAARTGDRLALASAICKVAAASRSTPVLACAAGGDVGMRVRALAEPDHTRRPSVVLARAAVLGALSLALVIAGQLPGELAAGAGQLAGMHASHPEACSL